MKYSFVMPSYKAEFIRESIQSILNQSYPEFELIIIDDCSPQDIKSVVDEFRDCRIKYFKNDVNIGGVNLVRQWNNSVKYSSGEWIILATDDDIYDRHFLSTADALLKQYPTADIFRARVCDFEKDINMICLDEPPAPEIMTMIEYSYYRENFLLGGIPQFVFRRSALDAIGGFINFPLAWYSDDATSIKMSNNGIVCSAEVLVFIRCSDINLSAEGKFIEEKILARFLFNEYFFNNILIENTWDVHDRFQNFYAKKLRSLFPISIKGRLLANIYQLPLYKRFQYLREINEHTPYLSLKDKLIMKVRLFVKSK